MSTTRHLQNMFPSRAESSLADQPGAWPAACSPPRPPCSRPQRLAFFRYLPLSPAALLFLASLAFVASRTSAQPVISSPPAAELVPASMRQITGPTPSTAAPTPGLISRPARDTPFYWGPLSVYPHFSDRFIYSDGLQVAAGRPLNSYVNSFSPGVRMDLGRNWTVDYTATWTVYTNKSFHEALDHDLRAAGTLPIKNWVAHFEQGYSKTTQPMIETARQTGRETVATRFGVMKVFNRQLSVESNVSQRLEFVEAAPDFYTWSTDNWVRYRLTKLEMSAGFSAGYVDMVPGANMAYISPLGRVSWQPSGKLTFIAQAGEEIRQIYARGVSARFTPVFEISADYGLFDNTRFTLTAGRAVTPSVLRNQMSEGTRWQVGFSQRLLGHFTVNGSYGEQETRYVSANSRVAANRKDKVYTYSLRVGTTFLQRGSVNLLFQETDNTSNSAGFGFNSTQTGVEVGYRY